MGSYAILYIFITSNVLVREYFDVLPYLCDPPPTSTPLKL